MLLLPNTIDFRELEERFGNDHLFEKSILPSIQYANFDLYGCNNLFYIPYKYKYIIIDDNSIDVKYIYQELKYRGTLLKSSHGFHLYEMRSEESMYLQLLNNVLSHGHEKSDRTNIGTLSIFTESLQFSLQNNKLPLLSTKKVFYKGVLEELLWFLSGSTDARVLSNKGVKIWDKNGSKENLHKHGFTDRDEGDLGPVYGFQWRNWGSKYSPFGENPSNGFDQIKELINNIRMEPNSRRHILSAWNVTDISKMILPPCHIMCQFYVTDDLLSCMVYQRSADLFLGVPFNIASYALLTCIIAKLTNLKPHKLIMNFGDVHIYKNHIDAVKTQLSRNVLHEFPTIHIHDIPDDDIDNITKDHFTLSDYEYQSTIKAEMAV
jgi:thymidylate synthase